MVSFLGRAENTGEAASLLKKPGDTVLVERGVPRLLILRCPCGCGDDLLINLDKRAGPAWRLYFRANRLTLFPSYWRDSGCGSHFILWNDEIFWCDWDSDEGIWQKSNRIEGKVRDTLPFEFIDYQVLAEQIDEVPWDVLQACYQLVREGAATANFPKRKQEFKRVR